MIHPSPANNKSMLKNALKPTLLKVILTILFLVTASILWRQFVISTISDTFPWGFPFQFYLGWGPCQPRETCFEFNGLGLVLDIAIWYLVSGFMVVKFGKSN